MDNIISSIFSLIEKFWGEISRLIDVTMGLKNGHILSFIENKEYLGNFVRTCFFSESNGVVLLVPILSDQGAHEKINESHENE